MRGKHIDKIFLGIVTVLLLGGFLIFTSASLGLLARTGVTFSSVALSQFLAIVIGASLALIASKIHYTVWRRWSFFIFVFSVIVTLLVFVPHIGLEHGGGKRWIAVGSISFQPAELLKIAFVMYCAALLASAKDKVDTFKGGLLPVIILLFITGAILLKQPDTDTFVSIFLAAMGMFIVAGGKFRHLFSLVIVAGLGLAGLIYMRPYLMSRILTFVDPARDPLGAGYQIQQSLVAVGSGGLFGRGFGQSIQKFSYLPEPIGDSILRWLQRNLVYRKCCFTFIFFFFYFEALRIASKAPDMFGGLLTVGIAILIVSGSFMNIGSMIGVMPLSGLPLLFVSHGGSAMVFVLVQVGIILNVSKFRKHNTNIRKWIRIYEHIRKF